MFGHAHDSVAEAAIKLDPALALPLGSSRRHGLCALAALHAEGQLDAKALAQAIKDLGVDPNKVYSADLSRRTGRRSLQTDAGACTIRYMQ